MDPQATKKKNRSPAFVIALIPLLVLIGLYVYTVIMGGEDPHPALIAAAVLAALLALIFYRRNWASLEEGVLTSSHTATYLILLFLMAVVLNSVWVSAGILPSLVYYGGQWLAPSAFLYITLFVFAFLSFVIGSPWISVALLGPSFMAMAALLGQTQEMAAGVILSGAYLGGRLSPFAMSNYLATSVSGSQLTGHLKHSLATALPALAVTLASILYFEPQMRVPAPESRAFLDALPRLFTLSPYLLILPLLLVILLFLRLSALPVFFIGILAGSLLTVFYQGEPVQLLWTTVKSGSTTLMESLCSHGQAYGSLMDKGGLGSQWWTVTLILCALVFGGVMKASGLRDALAKGLAKGARGRRTLGAMAVLASLLTNLVSPDPYLSMVVPARLLKERPFPQEGLERNLSRALADTGPPTAALVPWSMSGMTMAAFLGVQVWVYVPWAVFNWALPLIALLFSLLGLFSDGKGGKVKGKIRAGGHPSDDRTRASYKVKRKRKT